MELLVLILNKTECLKTLLSEFVNHDIKGATILDSQGMAHNLYEYNELRFVGSLRMLLDPEHKESKTILLVIEKEKIPLVSEIVNKVTGGLNHPDTGVIFTLSVNYIEGFGDKK
ncbi:MAG: hypothetical protein IKX77_03915 [Clostridia bacterium]|nr:hypothetical protein [Clostridia bacterium]